MQRLILPYAEARERIQDADLAFWLPTNAAGEKIASLTHGDYSHVGSLSWAFGCLETHDMQQWEGGVTKNLSTQVRKSPEHCDIYRITRSFNTERFISNQRHRAGNDYNWEHLRNTAEIAIGLNVLPGRGTYLTDVLPHSPAWNELYWPTPENPVFCSEGVAADLRLSGLQVLSDKAAWEVWPNMLAGLLFVEYQFTLGWE